MQTLVTVHSWVRWLVLVALLGGLVLGILRYRSRADWSPHYYSLMVMIVDVQVTVGLVIWLFYDGWKRGFFFSVLHPSAMLLALAAVHVAMALARRREDARSWQLMTAGSAVSLLLVIGAIPWDRLF